MYRFKMEREKLKNILMEYYVNSTANSILRGIRKPSYEVIVKIYKEHNIHFEAWLDINSYLNSTKDESEESNTPQQRRVS